MIRAQYILQWMSQLVCPKWCGTNSECRGWVVTTRYASMCGIVYYVYFFWVGGGGGGVYNKLIVVEDLKNTCTSLKSEGAVHNRTGTLRQFQLNNAVNQNCVQFIKQISFLLLMHKHTYVLNNLLGIDRGSWGLSYIQIRDFDQCWLNVGLTLAPQ